MSLLSYLFDILHATDAGTLHAYRADALADDMLSSDEKDEICRAVDTRFHELNKQAVGPGKARWS